MIHLADCDAKLPDLERSASPILRHLLGVSALAQLESGERQRLEGVRWLVRSVGKSCSLIDQGEDREMVGVLLSGWAFRYQTLPDGKRQILDFVFAGALVGFGSGNTYSYGVETVTTCSACGKETTVPFRPTQGRPVFCKECFQSRKFAGAGGI